MTQTRSLMVAAAALFLLPVVAGCVPQDHGWAPTYQPEQQNPVQVVMPPNAPSISQQFLVTTSGAKHLGIDVVGDIGDPVIAVADGVVVRSFSEPAYGNWVEIDHGTDASGKRTVTAYKHLKKRMVAKGDVITRGQQIGTLGATGALSGGIPHLHFELYRQSGGSMAAVDPHRYWANGVGRVTCFDPAATYDATHFSMTYPAPCR